MDPRLSPLAKIKDPFERRLAFAAVVSEEFRKRGRPAPVLVGGSALEIYTSGQIATRDIDVVTADTETFRAVCRDLGLEALGRHFLDRTLELAIEAPGSEVPERVVEVLVDGVVVRVTSIEDLIVDRLCAAVFWKSARDADSADMLLRLHGARLDRAYLVRRAKEEDVLPALEEACGRPEGTA